MRMEFEARLFRFVSTGDISILNERAFSFFRMKHLLYFLISIFFLWRGMNGSPSLLAMGSTLVAFSILTSLLSRGAMSFEAKMMALLSSILEMTISLGREYEG
jgi:hypothetical protein